MEDFFEILKYVIPAFITGGVALLMMKKMIEQENTRHMIEVRKENIKHTTPIRIQAHERLILLLERIDPVKVVNRVIKPGMTTKQIKFDLIRNIKEEFEHNITQQLYVSPKCWKDVETAREDALKLITVAATATNPSADAIEFSKNLIKIQSEQQFYTSLTAIETVKKEISKLF